MPSLHVHRALAERTLERWAAEGEEIEGYMPSCPASRNAFFAGAYGPDLGYFPGGDRVISDLAHCVRSGELTRCLLESAKSQVERCYAAGWLTHVLGDVLIHPLVARAVGQLLYGSAALPVPGATAPAAHVRVETGLDTWFATGSSNGEAVEPVFDTSSVAFLQGAFKDVYGLEVAADRFLSSERAASRGFYVGTRAIAWLGRTLRVPGMPVSRAVVSALRAVCHAFDSFGVRPLALAFLSPTEPPPWLLDSARECMDRLPRMVFEHLRTRGRDLKDYNLDTGEVASSSTRHRTTREAVRFLGWNPEGLVGDPRPVSAVAGD